jgi:spore maturation protein CgeB
MDEFTFSCFSPECVLIPVTPADWEACFIEKKPDVFFVESTWKGNDSTWTNENRLHKIPTRSPESPLFKILAYCKTNNIPTVFWNKEDPFGFQLFSEAAKNFDFIFTTDDGCVPEYKKICGHDCVFTLPFAAQPAIHNPLLTAARANAVCFAGTYYTDMFDERREQMEIILNSAKNFDFVIYDRMHGYTGPDRERFLFPARFKKFIKGVLKYPDMVNAYKKYKVFLNINSIVTSKTMFARRVFELLASGTPVVSTASKSIGEVFPDLVLQIADETEGHTALEKLFSDETYWRRLSAKGVREVLQKHTYAQRLREVLEKAGIAVAPDEKDSVFLVIKNLGKSAILLESIERQTLKPTKIILTFQNGAVEASLRNSGHTVAVVKNVDIFPALQSMPRGQILAFWDARDYYGAEYLYDAVHALKCSPFNITGMSAIYQQNKQDNSVSLIGDAAKECALATSFFSATVLVQKHFFLTEKIIQQLLEKEEITTPPNGFSRYAFEYAKLSNGEATTQTRNTITL